MTALPSSLHVTPPLTKLVSSRAETVEVIKKLTEELQGSADCDFVTVALLQEEDSLFFVPVKPERLPGSQGEAMPISKARLVSECLERRAVVYEPDLSHKSQIGALEHLLPRQIRSLVAVPLLVSQSSVGALVLGSSRPNAYSREWQQLLSILGRQVGLHLENLMLLLVAPDLASKDLAEAAYNDAEKEAAQLCASCREEEVKANWEVVVVDAATDPLAKLRDEILDILAAQIVGRAAKPDIGLVVLGSHDAHAEKRLPRGGVATRVINWYSKPVVMVPLLPPRRNSSQRHRTRRR